MSDSCYPYSRGSGLANTLYKTPSQYGGDFRAIAKPRPKTYEAVSAWQRREMVDVSRVIAAGVPNIDTALIQAGEFSVGDAWQIKYRGTNKGWGKKRDDWFNQTFSRDCNLRGRMNDWRSSLRQFNWTRKVEGDYAIVFDGQPHKDQITGQTIDPTGKFQVIKFDRINSGLNGCVALGNGLDDVKEVGTASYSSYFTNGWGGWIGMYIINDPTSPFDGQRILDGVIVDANMRVLGYRITGFNKVGMPTCADVPKDYIQFNFSARKQVDLIRGIPEIAEAIVPQMGLDDIQYLVTMAIKLASALAISRESTDGNPASSGRATRDFTTTDVTGNNVTIKRAFQEIYPGLFEVAVNNKEKLTVLPFDRPSMNEERFIERVETSVLHKLWPRNLIYSGDAGRAGVRATGIQARTICEWDQSCLERDARWIANHATAFAMRMDYIPTNNILSDPYESVFTVPREFTVDEGNDLKMRLAALSRGIISRGKICELDGYLLDEIEEERIGEVDRQLTAAEALHKTHPDFMVTQIALMLDSAGTMISFSEQDRDQVVDSETGAAEEDETVPTGADAQPAKTSTNAPATKKGKK
jgi:hypothetical protein